MSDFNFDNSYTKLPEVFFKRIRPEPVRAPVITVYNAGLAASLGLSASALPDAAEVFAGNTLAACADPVAQAYAGHQFGNFTMLGDGRAILLGEHLTPNGERFDIQLKGSGRTPFSRRGDGRAALGPMLREYIISEAMHFLKIPTTRSLCVVQTGERVERETSQPGGILTRVASSHIRVGTFQYAAALEDPSHLRTLADYTMARHFPGVSAEKNPYLAFLRAVISRQASLIAKWMHVGFIHGVMNTDNMALSGETIDYGPCAFMDRFSHDTVFSSIDQNGRYAYGNQPQIAQWNLTRFAEALLPLLSSRETEAVALASEALQNFAEEFQQHWLTGMLAKLGVAPGDREADLALVAELIRWMEKSGADHTETFRALTYGHWEAEPAFQAPDFLAWSKSWRGRRPDLAIMKATNPTVIPRNHRVEEALAAAVERADHSVMHRLLAALKEPFRNAEEATQFLAPPAPGGARYKTYCGT